MDDLEFKALIKQALSESRAKFIEESNIILELGDTYGDVDLGGWSDLKGAMGQPGRAVRATMGATAAVANKARTLMTKLIAGIPSLIVPYLKTNYKKLDEDEKKRQSEIERMYPDVFSVAKKAFPDDTLLFAFMLDPVLILTSYASKIGLDVSLDLTDALSGHSPHVLRRTSKFRRRIGTTRIEGVEYKRLVEDDEMNLEFEPDEPTQNKQDDKIKRFKPEEEDEKGFEILLKNPMFQSTLISSKPVQDIMQQSRIAKNTKLNGLLTLNKNVLKATSVQDLIALGLDIHVDEESLKASTNTSQIKAEEQKLLDGVKAETTNDILSELENLSNELSSKHVPGNSSFFKALKNAKEKLGSKH